MAETSVRWLPEDFEHPRRVELSTGHHLRPISAADTDLDMVAVMGSQERLFSIYGRAWGWPPPTMTADQDREDLQHHADDMEKRASFNYTLFDREETALLGCVYIDPPERVGGADAVDRRGLATRAAALCRPGPDRGRVAGPRRAVTGGLLLRWSG